MRTGRLAAIAFAAALATACASAPAAPTTGPQFPAEIRQGRASFVFQPVEEGVSEEEIAATLRPLIARAPICVRFPSVWLDGPARLGAFTVRFDLMARDWGVETADAARARMDALVEMGFFTATTAAGGAVAYTLTPLGRTLMRGAIASGQAPIFCGQSEQQLIRIVAIERGEFLCGSLRVRFAHSADHWPAWATSEAAHRVVSDAGLAPGAVGEGHVSLSRRWYARETLPDTIVNGSLGSLCYDAQRDIYQGDDFTFLGGPSEASPPAAIETTPLGAPPIAAPEEPHPD